MRQEDGGELVKVFGLVIFEPKDLRSRVAGQHRVADGADRRLGAAEFRGDFLALGGRRSVAPEFGRSNDFARLIERNETVLLPLTPMALTSEALALACRRACRMALAAASRQVCGCCSLAPGGSPGIRS